MNELIRVDDELEAEIADLTEMISIAALELSELEAKFAAASSVEPAPFSQIFTP